MSEVFPSDGNTLSDLVNMSNLIVVAKFNSKKLEPVTFKELKGKVSAHLKSGQHIFTVQVDEGFSFEKNQFSHLNRTYQAYTVEKVLKGKFELKKELIINDYEWSRGVQSSMRYILTGLSESLILERYSSNSQAKLKDEDKKILFLKEDAMLQETYQTVVFNGFENVSELDQVLRLIKSPQLGSSIKRAN